MKAFEVFGEIGLQGLPSVKTGLGEAARSAKAYEKTSVGAYNKAGAAFGKVAGIIGGVAITRDLWQSAQAAGDLAEQTSKAGVVFGDAADAVYDFSKTSAESFGISERAALTATGTFGNLFRSLKMGEQDSAAMSVRLVQLGADLASFNNANPEDVLMALRSGLVGETEPLRQFGINLNDVRLKEKALALGLITTTKETLPASAKAQAAYALILEDTALAQGDFARTSDGLANQQRILAARFDDAKTKLGDNLTPALLDAAEAGNDLLEVFNDMDPAARNAGIQIGGLTAASAYFGSKFGPMGTAIGATWGATTATLGSGITNLSKKFQDLVTDGGDVKTIAWLASLQLEGAANTAEVAARKHDTLSTSMQGAKAATEGTAGAVQQECDAVNEATAAIDDKVRAMDGYMVAAEDLSGVQRTLTELEIASKGAALDVRDARERLTEAIKDNGKGSDEAKRAALNLERAELRAADAVADLKTKQEEYGTTAAEVAKDRSMIDRMNQEAAAAGRAADAYRSVAQRALALKDLPAGSTRSGIQRKYGGRTTGPDAGYPVTMHGIEWVIPERPGDANALRQWQEAGRAIGAMSGANNAANAPQGGAQSAAASNGGAVYILADDRFTDMSKLGRWAEEQQRGSIGAGRMMARMGMGSG